MPNWQEPDWVKGALEDLARLRTVEGIRRYIAALSNRIDADLQNNPMGVGESREGTQRIGTVHVDETDAKGLLLYHFEIVLDDHLARVVALTWHPNRPRFRE